MAKNTPVEDPANVAPIATAADSDRTLAAKAAVANAKLAVAESQPSKLTKIERPGLGRKSDGRRGGGNFSLKLLRIKDFATDKTRELRVPLHMEPKDYPTLQPTEAPEEEFEEEYTAEGARDRVLSMQEDPFATDEFGQPVRRRLGFGPFDPGRPKAGTEKYAGMAKSFLTQDAPVHIPT